MNGNHKAIGKYLFVGVFVAGAVLSLRLDFAPGIAASGNFREFIVEMAAFLPLMFILIGLIDVWIPHNIAEKHIGKDAGVKGSLWVIALAMLQAGPLYGAFPVAYLLWKKGCSLRNIFIYLGAFSTVKIPMLTFEIGFLGFQFTLLRTLFTLPVFIAIAIMLEAIFLKSDIIIANPNDGEK